VLINRDATVTTQRYTSLWKAIERRNVQVIEAQAGQDFTYGDVHLRVLWPTPDGLVKATSTNDRSLVVRLTYGQEDLLFTGDAPDTVEKELVASHTGLASEVLKVGHHGSAKSTTPAFLKAVRPEIATISVGARNTYGHPTKRVLNDLQRVGTKVYRTDEIGDVLIVCSISACEQSEK
jgi:beta-lactamase superfamily II metal-dependent hydrolase